MRETLKSGTFEIQLPLGLQAGAAYLPDNNSLPLQVDDLVAFLESLTGEVANADPPAELPKYSGDTDASNR